MAVVKVAGSGGYAADRAGYYNVAGNPFLFRGVCIRDMLR